MELNTLKEFFEKTLPNRFDANKAAGIDVTIQVSITGADGGDWVVIIKNQKLDATEKVCESPDLLLKMKREDFLDLVNHKMSPEKAFLTGKVQFKGDIALAMKLRQTGFL